MNTAVDLRTKIRALQELPPPPAAAQRILAVLGDEDVDVHRLSTLIEQHPTLAARILGLARSAYFANSSPARSVKDAIVRVLGLQLTRGVAMAVVTSGALQVSRSELFDAGIYWEHALTVAFLARALSHKVPGNEVPSPDEAYLLGLLSDFGLIALTHIAAEEMDRVFATARESAARLIDIEQLELGVSHGQAGAWLAFRWHLPEPVSIAMAHHADTTYRGPHWLGAAIVGVSAYWLHCRRADREDCGADPRLAALGVTLADLDGAGEACLRDVEKITQMASAFSGS